MPGQNLVEQYGRPPTTASPALRSCGPPLVVWGLAGWQRVPDTPLHPPCSQMYSMAAFMAILATASAFQAPALQLSAARLMSVRMQEAAAEGAVDAAVAEEEEAPTPPPAPVSSPKVMSEALPFVERPTTLDGRVLAGDVGFDPLGFSNHELGPFDTPEAHLGWMREAEIKHGRICMLGTVGWIAADLGLRAPGVPAELKAASLSSYAAHDVAVADGRLLMLLILCGVFEIAGSAAIKATLDGKREPGEFALVGFMGKLTADPKKLAALKQAEIKHCRLGMMAFSGIATQTAVQGGTIGFPYF